MLVAGDVIYSKMRLNAPPHYFILLTDPDADGHALTVNITTECGDVTTVCGPHQYGALSHSSEVFYAAATFADAVTFETAALAGGAGKLTMRKESRCSAAFLRNTTRWYPEITKNAETNQGILQKDLGYEW